MWMVQTRLVFVYNILFCTTVFLLICAYIFFKILKIVKCCFILIVHSSMFTYYSGRLIKWQHTGLETKSDIIKCMYTEILAKCFTLFTLYTIIFWTFILTQWGILLTGKKAPNFCSVVWQNFKYHFYFDFDIFVSCEENMW